MQEYCKPCDYTKDLEVVYKNMEKLKYGTMKIQPAKRIASELRVNVLDISIVSSQIKEKLLLLTYLCIREKTISEQQYTRS